MNVVPNVNFVIVAESAHGQVLTLGYKKDIISQGVDYLSRFTIILTHYPKKLGTKELK